MSSSFAFSFSGDDIDPEGLSETGEQVVKDLRNVDLKDRSETEGLVSPKVHELEEMNLSPRTSPLTPDQLATLPSNLSYDLLPISTIRAPTSAVVDSHTIQLPRRTHFDIRAQLLAEVDPTSTSPSSSALLSSKDTDLLPTVYEGGLKTWECSRDLASFLLSSSVVENGSGSLRVIELGCGTALPTLALLHSMRSGKQGLERRIHITLADYNERVLQVATIPNLLLTWAKAVRCGLEAGESQGQSNVESNEDEGELEVTPELLERFKADLQKRGIFMKAVSGAWGTDFVEKVKEGSQHMAQDQSDKTGDRDAVETLILASETIYSPTTLQSFVQTVLALLKNTEEGKARAFLAAKKVYFGVGGGVQECIAEIERLGGTVMVVWESAERGNGWPGSEGEGDDSSGVGRVILEVLQG
ncbi:MAG: hypothetical protein Q9227_005411 [Pyrenula ochraceoflavens]